MRKSVVSSFAALSLLVSGCSYTKQAGENFGKQNADVDRYVGNKSATSQLGAVIHDDNPMLGSLERPPNHGDPLPSRCAKPMTLQQASPVTLMQLKDMISTRVGLPVEIDPRVYVDPDDELTKKAESEAQANKVNASARNIAFLGNGQTAGGMTLPATPATMTITPNFSGPCDEIFDQIAADFDLAWRMNGKTLSFDKYVTDTVTFRISDASTKSSSSLMSGGNNAQGGGSGGGSASGGGSGAQTQQTASYEINADVWKDIDASLKNMLPRGSKYNINKTAGFATITTTPRNWKDIRVWAEKVNGVLGATVQVDVTAFYITVSDSDNYGLDVSALYQAGTHGGAVAGLSGLLPSLSTTGGSANVGILTPTTPGNNFNTHFAGSQVYLNAVTTSQHNAEMRTATVIGRNGMPMPIDLSTNQDIVRSLTSAVGLQYGTTSVTAQTTTINYGFSLTTLARIISPGVVNVFLAFSASDLTNLTNFQIGTTGTVELATIDNRSVWTEMPLKSGQTLVMAGTEQMKTTKTGQGVGDDLVFNPLGSQQNGTVTRTRLLLLVTPTILATPK